MQQYLFEQSVDAGAGARGNTHKGHVAAELFGYHFFSHQLAFDAVHIGIGLVDLVDGHHDGYTGRFCMLDSFAGLRHHAVIGRNHQNHDVGGLRASGTHGRESLVTRRIQKGHHAARSFHVVGANVLGNAAGLTRRHFGCADVVEQRGLAMVNVAHDGDHRCARQGFSLLALHVLVGECFRIIQRGCNGLVTHFFHHDHGGVLVQRLIDGDHLSELHQLLDDF